MLFCVVSVQANDDIEVMEFNYSVPDVVSAFNNLTEQGEGLSVHLPGTVVPYLSNEEFLYKIPFKSHIQGVTRSSRSGVPLFFLAISANHYHPEKDFYDAVTRPGVAVVQLGSRTESGERVRSNRLQKGTETTFTEGLVEDQVINFIETEYMGHPSGMGMVGDILAVPNGEVRFFNTTNWLDDESENDGPIFEFSKKIIINKGNDEDDCDPFAPPEDGKHGSQAMGITNLPDGRFLLIFNSGACEPVHFYWSNKTSFFDENGDPDPAFTFDPDVDPTAKYVGFDRAQLEGNLTDAAGNQYFDYWPNKKFHGNKRAHQSVSLVVEGEDESARVFVIGSSNSDEYSPVLGFEGSDDLYLLEVTNFQKGMEENVTLTPVAKKTVELRISGKWASNGTYSFTEIDPESGVPAPKIVSKRWQGNLNAAGYAYVSPSGELLYYAANHFADGPGHTIKMAEFRHNHVVRDDSPKYFPGVETSGPYEVNEGSIVILDGSLSQPVSLAPWIHLFEHTNYDGRSIMVDYEDWDFDDYDDFSELDGQCADLENFGLDLEGFKNSANALVGQVNNIASFSYDDLVTTYSAGSLCDWVCNQVLADAGYPARATCRGDYDVSGGIPTACNTLNWLKGDFPDLVDGGKRANWFSMIGIYEPLLILYTKVIALVNDIQNEECDPFSRDDLWNPPTLPGSFWVFDKTHSNYKGIFGIPVSEDYSFKDFITTTFNEFIGSMSIHTILSDVEGFFNFFKSFDNTVDGAIDDLAAYFSQLAEYIEDIYVSTQGFNDRASSVRWYVPTGIDIIACDKPLNGQDNCSGDYFRLEGADFVGEIPDLKYDSLHGLSDWQDQLRSVKFDGTYVPSEFVGYYWSIVSPLPPTPLFLLNQTTVTPTFDASLGDGPLESTVELAVEDNKGLVNQATTTVQVLNVAPDVQIDRIEDQTGTSIDDSAPPVLLEAVEYVLFGSFTDPGVLDWHTVVVDWGDGTPVNTSASDDGILQMTDSLGGVTGTVDVPHVYAAKGLYPVTLAVEDKDGDSSLAIRELQVLDASDATLLFIDYLIVLLEEPLLDEAAVISIEKALSMLRGNQGGVATNGAIYFLSIGELNDALEKIKQAMIHLKDAVEIDPLLVTVVLPVQHMMTTVARSVANKAILKATTLVLSNNDQRKITKAYSFLAEGDDFQIAGDFISAAQSYKDAAKAVQGII